MKIDPKVVVPPKAWSPSALEAYEECPRRFLHERLQKLCQKCFAGRMYRPALPGSGARGEQPLVCGNCGAAEVVPAPIAEGYVVHAAAEGFIRGHIKKVAPGLVHAKVRKMFTTLRSEYMNKRVRVELELAFTKAWSLTEWFGRDAWVRFKIDVAHLLDGLTKVYDWKSGRTKPDDGQLRAYATGALAAGLGERVHAALVFTRTGEVVPAEEEVRLAQLPKLKREWEKRASPLFLDKTFQPRPQYRCRFCPYSMNKGGPCPH